MMEHSDIKAALNTAIKTIDPLELATSTERYNMLIVDELLKEYPNTNNWVRSCYNLPRNADIILELVNEILHCFGVEGSPDTDGNFLSYVNTGETYDLTLCHYKGKFIISSWGDIVENNDF